MAVTNLKEDKPYSAFTFCCFSWEASLHRTSFSNLPIFVAGFGDLCLRGRLQLQMCCFHFEEQGSLFPPDYGRIDFKQ